MPARRPRLPLRPRVLASAAALLATGAVAVSAALAAPSGPIVVSDPGDDVGGALDATRLSLQRASDGRLRAVLTFAGRVTPKAMLASSGPPGSACLRIWTAEGADPKADRPDRLVCATARAADELRGGVYEVTGAGLPRRSAGASVKLNASGRSMVVRFSQSSLGRPPRIRFAAETTRPGCERPRCIDTVPDGGAARTFRLR